MEENSFNRARWEFDLTTKLPPEMPQKAKLYEGEMNMNDNKKSVKALKKQLAAAIAMVCVAAVALGSSTYAWFVTNNKVTAQTSNIKAMSNAAFMSIEYGKTAVGSTTIASTDWTDNIELFPAEVQNNSDAPKFVTAYGTSVSDGAKKGDYIEVGDAAKAVTDKYAIGAANNFNISSAGVDLSNLVIDKIEVTTGNDKDLASAIRVLVVGKNNWQVWGADGKKLEKTTDAPLETTIARDKDTPISVYVYYDGNDSKVRTDNLTKLEGDTNAVGVTITFSATQPETVTK